MLDDPAGIHRDVERQLRAAGWTLRGQLVVIDLLYADGPRLYAAEPERIAALIPERERRYMTEIPPAASGPWDPAARAAMRAALAPGRRCDRGRVRGVSGR